MRRLVADDGRKLRSEAEARRARNPQARTSSQPTAALLRELQVHQIELELQNEALRAAHEALERSHDRYVDLFDYAPIGYLTLSTNGLIREANLTAAGLLNAERKSLVGRPFAAFVASDAVRWHLLFSDMVRGGDRATCDLELRRSDESVFDGRLSCQRRPAAGKRACVHVQFTDVTEQRRAEARHLDALQAAIESLPIAVTAGEVSPDGAFNLTNANRAFDQLLGSPVPRGALTPANSGAAYLPDRKTLIPVHEWPGPVAARHGRVVRDVEMHVKRSDGEWRIVTVSAAPLEAPAGAGRRSVAVGIDVTARRRAEDALREGRERLANVLEASSDGYWERDLVTGQVLCSARMSEIVGRPALETVAAADEWVRRTHPDDLLVTEPAYARVLAGEEERFDQVFRTCHADGSWRWVRGRAKVTARDAVGRPTRLSGTITDIHDGMVAQERLVASEARFRAIASSTSVGIFQTDAAGNYVFLNPAGEKIMGLSAQEARGSGWADAIHPDDRDRVLREWSEAAAAGREFRSEYRFLLPGRDATWVQGFGSTVWGAPGKSLGYAGVFVDITDRKRAEDALASSEASYRRLFESLTDGLAVVDMRGAILESNEAYRQMLGYSAEELRTKTYLELTPESWHTAEARIVEDQVIPLGHSPVYEKEYRRKDGSIFPVELRTFLIRKDGRPTAMWAIVRDITETRTLRLQLATASRLAAMGTLVAGIAHEVNNPLSAELSGQGFAQEVVDDVRVRIAGSTLPGRDDLVRQLAQAAEALDDAQAGGHRIARIVKDMAALASPDPRRRRLKLIDVVEDARRWLLASVAEGCPVKVEDRGSPDVLASAGEIEQVLLILVSNAALATARGTDREIVIRIGTGGTGMARMEVVDHGAGISPAILDRVFDPFFTTRQVGEPRGIGLGLAVGHAIATSHGGTITVESELGKGSTFRVELPAAPVEG